VTRAVAVFTVALRGLKLRVRVLATEGDVDIECRQREGRRQRGTPEARAFFAPAARLCSVAGTIVLPADGRLDELVPHEVVHAVMYRIGGVHCTGDERLATDVGLLTARIFQQLKRRGIEVMS
jgi:hypothetical protein